MNYSITENEYRRVEDVRAQLSLVAGLLTASGANSSLYDASDLYAFIAAQIDTLGGVIKSADARYDAARNQNNKLSFIDWANMLQVVSGRRAMRRHDLKELGRKLQNCITVDPDMALVFDIWKDVMTNGGEWPFSLEPSSTDGFHIQYPERVAVMQKPEPTAKKPAPRKREKLTKSVDEVLLSQSKEKKINQLLKRKVVA